MPDSFAEQLREFALSFDQATEVFSFGPDHPVYKAANGKMFAVAADGEEGTSVSLKLTSEEALEALSLPFVRPAPYMARNHWVQSVVTTQAEWEMTAGWIRRSHELVTAKPVRKGKS